jgi:glycosyltransferase involved in cell wall biosynthesis
VGRVAIFLPSLAGGGAERVMLNVATELVSRGAPVDLVLATADNRFRPLVPPKARLIEFGARRVLFSLPSLAGYLRREQPAVLLTAMEHANLVGLLARSLACRATPTIVSVHFDLGVVARDRWSRWERGMNRLRPWLYLKASSVVTVSEGVRQHLLREAGLPPSQVITIPNPVVFPDLAALASTPVSDPWFAPGAPPVVLGVGRLTFQKDFGTLIRAFARLRERRPARLVLLGEGEERAGLEALVSRLGLSGWVALRGFADNPFGYMARAGVVALSSRYEGFGNVLVESMACGTPVVSTNCRSGPAEILDGGRFGRLVPVGDDAALAAALEATLEDPVRPDRWRARAAEYGVATIVDRYLRVFADAAGPAAGFERLLSSRAAESA